MPRYIDADEALRMIRNSKQDCPFVDGKKSVWDVAHDCAVSCVDAVPTADIVAVVRCKNCMFKVLTESGRVMCSRIAKKSELNNEWYGLTATDDNHYCSYGKTNVQEVKKDVR